MDLKNKLREGLTKNMLGVEVTRPEQALIIMRGIPGSGKSTESKKMVAEGIIHSTDDLWEATGDYKGAFKKMVESGDWSEHGKMHHKNFLCAKKSMEDGITPVIIDNTNIKAGESKKYVEAALKMGMSENHIGIVDVGDGGCTAEELAERNTHAVPLETIQRMMSSHKGVGPLTVKKIMEAKDGRSKILYSAVVLDDKSKSKLFTALKHKIPKGWEIFVHHMTIIFGKALPEEMKEDLGKNINLVATHIGGTDKVIAVKVSGYPSTKGVPHITLAVDLASGGTPRESGDITKWEPLGSIINISGVVSEVKPK